ncbi:Mgm101p-domain-containing protein [Aulographum hederae CBS 113979]|uniref:Mitochondrial genome maintenance protein MGM101 n=1 Tax=Aulographum hederae CBS 113979 TaxID=1176131 RepID=A0A6G1H2J9_9PEZI|nr:Mgm101p-domain-containing protein [Aulographum hederae CBS 113979]
MASRCSCRAATSFNGASGLIPSYRASSRSRSTTRNLESALWTCAQKHSFSTAPSRRAAATATAAKPAATPVRTASSTYAAKPSTYTPKPAASTTTSSTSPSAPSTPSTTSSASSPSKPSPPLQTQNLTNGLNDAPPTPSPHDPSTPIDWTISFHGLSSAAFSPEAAAHLLAPINPLDVEIKPDGIVYLPEIKYRRILNKAFGPGAWGLAPRGETIVTGRSVTREYALVAHGRLVSIARGEQQYFDPEGIPTATEGCKSNALMRCCKDLGVASELWDPVFIRSFMEKNSKEVWVEHVATKKKKKIWMRKDMKEVRYPFKEVKG